MTIAHLNLSNRAPVRLAALKRYAENGKWSSPLTWRNVRFATLKSERGLSQGGNGNTSAWYANPSKHGEFNREKFASDVIRMRHTGYCTDNEGCDTAKGVLVQLPHGKCIAGYYWSSNDERVYFPEIYATPEDAAHAADSHAESFAETCREDDAKWQAARELEDENENALTRLRECIALRHVACMDYVRSEITELCETIRGNRERLAGEFSDVL